jgi:putative ABC transport system permease protein
MPTRQTGVNVLDQIRADLRFAVRQFTHTPLLTATIVLVLALGIGVNVGAFTVLHGYLTHPVPGVPANKQLVRLHGTQTRAEAEPFAYSFRSITYPEIQELRTQQHLFASVAGERADASVLRMDDNQDAIPITTSYVTSDYFATLGTTLALGPGLPRFDEGDANAPLVAVIDHRIWRDQFEGRADVVGKTIKINTTTLTIVGVAPPRFAGTSSARGGTTVSTERAIWIPLPAARLVDSTGAYSAANSSEFGLTAIARLQPGANVASSGQILAAIAARHPTSDRGHKEPSTTIAPLLANNLSLLGNRDLPLASAMVAMVTFFVLLLTCTNVSSLLVGRAIVRRSEVAIRLAMGAARRRIVQQLLAESMLLSLSAGAVAVFVLAIVARLVDHLMPAGFSAPVDASVIGFTFTAALGTTLIFGLAPALHASKESVASVLKDSSRVGRRSRLQRGFVIAQMTLTQPLLVGLAVTLAGLLSFAPQRTTDNIESHIAVMRWDFGRVRSTDATATRAEFVRRVAELPGIAGVVGVGAHYLGNYIIRPGDEGPTGPAGAPVRLRRITVDPGYFDLMNLPLIRGRDFNETDHAQATRVVVIGSDLAERLWGAANPIGRRLQGADPREGRAPTELVVVGVVDAEKAGRANGLEHQTYGAALQMGAPQTLYIRSAGPASAILPAARALSRAIAPATPIAMLTTLDDMAARQERTFLQIGTAVGVAAVIVLLLASIGLYAVVALAVAQRRREIGIRMAIGAQARDVVRHFLGGGLRLAALGLALGLPLSLVALRFVNSAAGGDITDNVPGVGLAVGLLVTIVALVATLIPARRAAAVNPVIALRSE